MAKREIAPEERRVVSKKKKIVILVLFFVGLLALIWYKLPYEKTYTAELMIRDEGERPMYGSLVDVEIRVKVQRYFFYDTVHTGTVIVEGKVFAIEHKELKKRNAWVINFDMTDYTGSVRVNQFMETEKAKPILDGIKVGMRVSILGKMSFDRYDNEMVMQPNAIMNHWPLQQQINHVTGSVQNHGCNITAVPTADHKQCRHARFQQKLPQERKT